MLILFDYIFVITFPFKKLRRKESIFTFDLYKYFDTFMKDNFFLVFE